MLTRLHVSIVIGIAVVVWAIVLVLRGTPISWDHLIPFGSAVTAICVLTAVFDKWCWRIAIFKGWLVQRPWVHGTWRVVLQSNWIDPTTQRQKEPIHCFMVIRQTFFSLSVRLFTPESSSRSLMAHVLVADDHVFRVTALYQNDPTVELRGVRSEIHYGALMLDVHSEPVQKLSGTYWTDRSTRGTLELSSRRDKLVTSYSEGVSLYAGSEQAATLAPAA